MDWVDGYLTAMSHAGHLVEKITKPAEVSVWTVVPAVGGVLSAFAAGFAAYQSMISTRQTNIIAIETERSAVIRDAIALHDEASSLSETLVTITYPPEWTAYPSDITDEGQRYRIDMNDGFCKTRDAAAEALTVKDAALAAQNSKQIAKCKNELVQLALKVRDLKQVTIIALNRGRKEGFIVADKP